MPGWVWCGVQGLGPQGQVDREGVLGERGNRCKGD